MALCLLAFGVVLALPAAGFAAGVVGQQSLSTANNRIGAPPVPQLGADAAGNAYLEMATDKAPQGIQVDDRPAASGWNAVQEIGTTATAGHGAALAVDQAGYAMTAWADSATTGGCTAVGTNACLHVAVKPPGSSAWNIEQSFNPAGGTTALTNIAVALDPSGQGVGAVVWSTSPTPNLYRVDGISRSSTGTWSALANMWNNNTELPSQIRVAIDGSGRPVVIWAAIGVAGACPCGVRMSLGLGPAGALLPVTSGTPYTPVSLQRDAQGAVDAMWVDSPVGAARVLRTASIGPGASAAGVAADIFSVANTTTIVGPAMATASDGESVATWTDDASGGGVVRSVMAAVRPPGAAWASALILDGDTVDPSAPALAADAAGDVNVAWHNGSTQTLRYAVKPHGGSFGGTFDGPVMGAGQVAVVSASDAAGDTHVAWPSGNGTLATAVIDAAPPLLSLVALDPATLFAGRAVTFTSASSDIWSGVPAVHWDFGDGATANGVTVTHAYAKTGAYLARATATDSSGNQSAQTQQVQIAGPAAPGLPRPVAGRTVNLTPVTGTVFVKVPGATAYAPLVSPTQVRNGSIIDARHGRVRITIDNGRGGLDTADFYGGIFRFEQPKVKLGQTWFADLFLFGGNFKGCPAAPSHPRIAGASRKTLSAKRSVRHLWGSGKGAFRTVGRYSSATVRGTTWLTDDRCNGTLTRVTSGKVAVRDFVRKKTVVVTKRHRYFAAAKKR